MKIGILGTGDVGRALSNGFLATGCEVKLGSREANSEKVAGWLKDAQSKAGGSKASAGSLADAAKFAEVIVVATAWPGTENALLLAGAENLAGKVVIDVTNPLKFEPGKPLGLTIGLNDSGGEQVQRWVPNAHVVKAFNTVGFGHFFQPAFPGGPPTMFYCGNDAAAKKTVAGIIESFGWEPFDAGGIEGARSLEPMCVLWVAHAMKGSRNHAFKMLRK